MKKELRNQLMLQLGIVQNRKATLLEECSAAQALITKTLKEIGPVKLRLSEFWENKLAGDDRKGFVLSAFDDEGGTPVEFFEKGIGHLGWILEASVETTGEGDVVVLKILDGKSADEHKVTLDDIETFQDSVLEFILNNAANAV